MLQDPADVWQEAHVEHPIRLVEDQDLEPLEPRVGEAEVVEEPARGRDQDVHAAPERLHLGLHPDAAEDGRARHPHMARELAPVLVDLRGQLARGGEDERSRDSAAAPGQAVENRQHERGRLAAAGDGAGEHVPPGEAGRDGVRLDGRRRFEAHLIDGAQQAGLKVECGEGHGE